jgi:hypothetical protein
MSKITAIVEADENGTLNLPLPPELRHTKVRVTASLEAVKELRKFGTFKDIADPLAWQRARRRDRPLPGRD